MDPCHSLRPYARRSFIITPYRAGQDGRLEAVMPDQCIEGGAGQGVQCVVRVHHRRERKTGPEHALVVAECLTHGVAFTLYPPGFVPYGRAAIVPVDGEGELVRCGEPSDGIVEGGPPNEQGGSDKSEDGADVDREDEPVTARLRAPLAWELTLFRAAQDGARGKPWPRRGVEVSAFGSWRTQGRRIAMAAELLGLVAQRHASPLIGPLGISALGHQDASAAYQQAAGYKSRARAVVVPLAELERAGCRLLDPVLAAGFEAGRWGRAWRWNASRHELYEVPAQARSP
jgi:hypothetical protein